MLAPSIPLKIEALYDPWAFIDLIGYKGGTKNFDQCHFDYLLVATAPQQFESGRLDPNAAFGSPAHNLYLRWRFLTQEEYLIPTSNRMLKYPRGHLKSTLLILIMLWRCYRNPEITILHCTNVRELSESFIRELRAYFEDEYLQTTVWNCRPHIRGNMVPALDKTNRRAFREDNDAADKKIVWSNYQIQLLRETKRKEPTILSTSAGSKSTGSHFHIVVMDDVVDFVNSETDIKSRKIKRWAADIASVVTKVPELHHIGTLPDGTKFTETTTGENIVTGTHYNPHDYYAFLEENKVNLRFTVFNRNIYTNGVDNSEGYLWAKFTEEQETELRAALSDTPGVFEAQYLNFVNNPALQILSTALVAYVPHKRLLEGCNHDHVSFTNPDTQTLEYVIPIIAIDPAVSLRNTADFTAIVVGGISTEQNLVGLEFSVGHYTPEYTIQEVIRLIKLWKVRIVYCETIGFQSLLRDMILKAVIADNIKCGILPYSPTKWGNKLKRIETRLSPYFNGGNVVFSDAIKSNPRVINTFNFFGRGGRDDPPDALAVIQEMSRPPYGATGGKKVYIGRPREPQARPIPWNNRFGGTY